MNKSFKRYLYLALLPGLLGFSSACTQLHTTNSHWKHYDELGYCPFHENQISTHQIDQNESLSISTLLKEVFSTKDSNPSTIINLDEPAVSLIEQDNIWPHLRNHFALDLTLNNRRIQSQRNWYLKHQSYFDRVLNRSQPYLYYISEEIRKRQLPMELALLPIVESAYDPFAYSHGQASGIWQFIPSTGRRFGLKQNWWYDGRRDITASTTAALDYLEYLNKRFKGNWLHALAAYNSGEGTVLKAIKKNRRRNKPTDFWSLSLPKETRAYVPKLLALSQIINKPDIYNISLMRIGNFPYFEKVALKGQIDLAQAANMAELDLKTLYTLNPGFNRWATDPEGPHQLLIPLTNVEIFLEALKKLTPEQQVSWKRYTIKSGDSLSEIARKNHITVSLLKKINRLNSNRIRAGHTLLIPSSAKKFEQYQLSSRQRLLNKQKRKVPGKSRVSHRVKSGDSLWNLSRKYKVSVSSLARWNNMAPKDTLKVGQKLVIWTNTHVSQNDAGPQVIRKVNYTVRKGDSLARIASKFNVKIAQLTQWNGLNKNKYLQPGQRITLFVDVTKLTM